MSKKRPTPEITVDELRKEIANPRCSLINEYHKTAFPKECICSECGEIFQKEVHTKSNIKKELNFCSDQCKEWYNCITKCLKKETEERDDNG